MVTGWTHCSWPHVQLTSSGASLSVCLVFPEAPTPHLAHSPLSKAKSGKVTRFFCQSPQALPTNSYSLHPAPPAASSKGIAQQGSAPACPSPCLFGHQDGYRCSPETHMNAAVTPMSKGENAICVCKDIPIVETTGRGALLPPGEASTLLRSLGMLVKPVGERLGEMAL